jgi:hypothetical protein
MKKISQNFCCSKMLKWAGGGGLGNDQNRVWALTLVELVIAVAVISTLLALFFSAIQSTKLANLNLKTGCADKIRKLGLATQIYNSAFGSLPPYNFGSPKCERIEIDLATSPFQFALIKKSLRYNDIADGKKSLNFSVVSANISGTTKMSTRCNLSMKGFHLRSPTTEVAYYTSCNPLIDVYCVTIYAGGRQCFGETLHRRTRRLDSVSGWRSKNQINLSAKGRPPPYHLGNDLTQFS